MFTAMALGMRAQATLTGKVVATRGSWSTSNVTYSLNDLYSELGYADVAAMKAALDAKEISITALNTEGSPVGGTNVGEGTQFTSNYTRTTTGVEEAGYNYGCFFMNAEGQVVGGWQYWKWNTEASEWQLVYGTFANHFDYDDTNIIIRLMQGNDGVAGIFTATITLSANDRSVVLKSTLIVQASQESDLTIVSEGSVYIQQTAHTAGDWSSDYKWYWFDNSTLLAAGATADFITDNISTLLYTSDGMSLVNTHNTSGNGFWFKGSNETICAKATESMEFYVDHLICNNESWIGFYIGQGYGNLTAGQHRVAPLYVIYGDKAVKLNVVLDIEGYVLVDKNDNQTVLNKLNNQSDVTVYLSGRTLKAGWNTMVLPFDVTTSQMETVTGTTVELATLTSATAESIQFTKVESVAANTPFLVHVNADATNLVFTGVNVATVETTPTATQGAYDFVGSYTATTAPAGSYVLTTNNTFKLVGNNDKTVNACRAYLKANGSSSVKANSLSVEFFDNETDISLTPNPSPRGEGSIYNLAGQRLNQPQKGINIFNGKKVMVK